MRRAPDREGHSQAQLLRCWGRHSAVTPSLAACGHEALATQFPGKRAGAFTRRTLRDPSKLMSRHSPLAKRAAPPMHSRLRGASPRRTACSCGQHHSLPPSRECPQSSQIVRVIAAYRLKLSGHPPWRRLVSTTFTRCTAPTEGRGPPTPGSVAAIAPRWKGGGGVRTTAIVGLLPSAIGARVRPSASGS